MKVLIETRNWDVETYSNELENESSFCVGRKLPGQPIINHHLVYTRNEVQMSLQLRTTDTRRLHSLFFAAQIQTL